MNPHTHTEIHTGAHTSRGSPNRLAGAAGSDTIDSSESSVGSQYQASDAAVSVPSEPPAFRKRYHCRSRGTEGGVESYGNYHSDAISRDGNGIKRNATHSSSHEGEGQQALKRGIRSWVIQGLTQTECNNTDKWIREHKTWTTHARAHTYTHWEGVLTTLPAYTPSTSASSGTSIVFSPQ